MSLIAEQASFDLSHLVGIKIPDLVLPSTAGHLFALKNLARRSLLVLHPLALAPEQRPPEAWNSIPSATGCTAQLLGFSAHHKHYRNIGIAIYGISMQSNIVQRAVSERLSLPFPLLSDAGRAFTKALKLPILTAGRSPRMTRMIIEVRELHISRIFTPSPPPPSLPPRYFRRSRAFNSAFRHLPPENLGWVHACA